MIAVLGAGGWGTALACHLGQSGEQVRLWARRADFAQTLQAQRENINYLPGVLLPDTVQVSSDLAWVCQDADFALVVVPSAGAAEVLQQLPTSLPIVLCTKGLGAEGEPLSVLVHRLGFSHYAVLSGPNHAEEIGRGLPAATTVASHCANLAKQVQATLMSPTLRVYTSTDMVGVELGGVLKNVIAVAAGMLDGLQLGDNAKAALITRGLLEMRRYLVSQGAQEETVYGLSGLGDLIATCTSRHSRNRAAGEALAQGRDPQQGGKVVEGMRTAGLLYHWSHEHHIELPIVDAVYQVIHQEITLKEGISLLMERSPKAEI